MRRGGHSEVEPLNPTSMMSKTGGPSTVTLATIPRPKRNLGEVQPPLRPNNQP